jgi:hypothetical protein
MDVSILAFPEIDTFNLRFTVDFFLNMRWNDLRIDFRDLNEISSLNTLNDNDQKSIWVPKLGFVNALGPFQTEVDELSSGELIRESGQLPEDYSTSIEGRQDNFWSCFSSSSNPSLSLYISPCCFLVQIIPFR